MWSHCFKPTTTTAMADDNNNDGLNRLVQKMAKLFYNDFVFLFCTVSPNLNEYSEGASV